MESTQRTINIKSVNGQIEEFKVPPNINIGELKNQIAERFQSDPTRLRLIYLGKLLRNEQSLSEYIQTDGVTIHMLVQENAPPPSPPQPQMLPQFINQIRPNMPQNIHNPRPLQPRPHHHHHPHPRPAPVQVDNLQLPFTQIHNIGNIVNQLMGPGAGFPGPSVPQLDVNMNNLVMLGGYMQSYYFQILRLLPFISRIADLFQRESLVNDPGERAMIMNMARMVGAAMREMTSATVPVAEYLRNVEVGNRPGEFVIRSGAPHIIHHHAQQNQQAQQHQQAQQAQQPGQTSILQQISNLSQTSNSNSPFLPLLQNLTTLLGAQNTNMTLRDLSNQLNIHDDDEHLPLSELIYGQTIAEWQQILQGDYSGFERVRQTCRDNVFQTMNGEDSYDNRNTIVELYVGYVLDQFEGANQFQNEFREGYSFEEGLVMITRTHIWQMLDLVIDRTESFGERLIEEFQLFLGEVVEEIQNNARGGRESVMRILTEVMRQSIVNNMGEEFTPMMLGMSSQYVLEYAFRCHQRFVQWRASRPARLGVAELFRDILTETLRDSGMEVPAQSPPQELREAFTEQVETDLRELARGMRGNLRNEHRNLSRFNGQSIYT